jgi:type III restriction enzyme
MQNLILQRIVEDISLDNLPDIWLDFDFKSFSKNKSLFDFQQRCLQNMLRALWLYYIDQNENKEGLFNIYKNNGYDLNLDYDLKEKEAKSTAKLLLEYDKNYPVANDKISYQYFINRMSFWMATGSGKTLIIVKLLEFLHRLIENKQIPKNDILFLTYRDDLIEQFETHIEEFNSYHINTKINLKSLKEYDEVKRENPTLFKENELTIFHYRSDLISDIQKEKLVDFRNYDNNGNWYILLDEAHKGDKEDSKRQIIYSILSRNGFLFNFSATFTDPRDYITCVFNFNLSKFIEEGYGKHIYISNQEVSAFRDKTDFSLQEKQKIILQTLLLLTYTNKFLDKIKSKGNFYHKPLMLTLVNSVNTEDSDLILFFKELEKVAKNKIDSELIEEAKQDILTQIADNCELEFEEDTYFKLETNLLSDIKYKDILKYVFNSNSPGAIEVLIVPGNRKELIFKLKTTDKPFALIKIGDISEWLKNKLSGYEIIEKFENESVFSNINKDDSDINILMGSRAFYEGWDSNRPNIILFINIGVGINAKKFVLQSVGRGVRIEPVKDKRRRLLNLYNSKEVQEELFNKIKNFILPLETLIVLGTNTKILKDIITTLKEEQVEKIIGTEFIINKTIEDKLLLIPTYKESANLLVDEEVVKGYPISRKDFDLTKSFFNYLGDLIVLVNYDCDLKTLGNLKESFKSYQEFYTFEEDKTILDPALYLKNIIDYFNLKTKKIDKFKKLEEEIVHFKKIKYLRDENVDDLLKNIRKVQSYNEKKEAVEKLRLDFEKRKDLDWYDREKEKIDSLYIKEATFKDLKIKYLTNHYYLPIILSEKEKIDYINHVINVESEVKFVEQLENYILEDNNFFNSFDWWLFSKIDEDLDEVYIPYYNSRQNRISKFKPDFIFWLQKENNYYIIFIDPKGTEYVDAYRKIVGFKKLFENDGVEKVFNLNELNIRVKLLLKPKDIADTLPEYRKYWFSNFNDLSDKIKISIV